jgi:hypothetical protein
MNKLSKIGAAVVVSALLGGAFLMGSPACAAGADLPDGQSLLRTGRAAFRPARADFQAIPLDWRLERLTSGAGRPEVFQTVHDPALEGIGAAVQTRPLGGNAVEFAFTFTNQGKSRVMLRSVLEATVPFAKYTWWNGYVNDTKGKFDPQDVFLSKWFPVNAALGDGSGVGNGVNPMDVYSRVDSTRISVQGRSALLVGLPFVLDPGQSFSLSHVVTAFPVHFGYRDAIQNYYDLFPAAYRPAANIDPRAISVDLSSLAWAPVKYNVTEPGDMIRRLTGGLGGWEWCYADAARDGDWANTDQWTVGWDNPIKGGRHGKWTEKRLKKFRDTIQQRLADTLKHNAAPMYYVNMMYAEKGLVEDHFADAMFDRVEHPAHSQMTVTSMFPGPNAYGDLFRQGLTQIAEEYNGVCGIGFDSVFGHRVIGTNVAGVEQTPRRSFNQGKVVAIEGAAHAALLDLNHSHQSGGRRMANAVNYKLVSPYFIGARTDTSLYEGSPMERPENLGRMESMRARLGSGKPLCWLKHSVPQRIGWVEWDRLSADQMRETYRQIEDDELLLSYYWGGIPAPSLPALGVERTFMAVPELIELTRLGWQPSPMVHVQGGVLPVRYGRGLGANVVLINPAFEDRTAVIQLDAVDWDGALPILAYHGQGALACTLSQKSNGSSTFQLKVPARDIVRLVVVGWVKSAKLTGPLTVQTERSRGKDGQQVCAFRLTGVDRTPLSLELAGDPAHPASQLTLLGKRSEFANAQPVRFTLEAADWSTDFQSENENELHARFYLDQYAPVWMQLNIEQLKKMELVAALKVPSKGVVIIPEVKSADAPAGRIAEWFGKFTSYSGKSVRPQVSNDPGTIAGHVAIHLSVNDGLKLEHGGVAVVRPHEGGGIEIAAQNASALDQAATALILKMDRAYPYVGKLPEKDPYIKAMGQADGELHWNKTVGRPVTDITLESRLKKLGLMK